MQGYLSVGNDITVLFKNWKVTSPGGMALVCLMTAALTFGREALAIVRVRAHLRASRMSGSMWRAHLAQTALQLLTIVIGNLIMLLLMTYSVWVLLSAILGAGVGYFGYGWATLIMWHKKRRCDVTQNNNQVDQHPDNNGKRMSRQGPNDQLSTIIDLNSHEDRDRLMTRVDGESEPFTARGAGNGNGTYGNKLPDASRSKSGNVSSSGRFSYEEAEISLLALQELRPSEQTTQLLV